MTNPFVDSVRAHELVKALRYHKHPLTQQAADRIAELEALCSTAAETSMDDQAVRAMREQTIYAVRSNMMRDDACQMIVPSDLRLLIGAIDQRANRIADLENDLRDTLRAVLHHFGPDGANKVTTTVLDEKSKR